MRNEFTDYIAHGHKYYTKVDMGRKNGKKVSRYFYSLAEYQAYLRDKKSGLEDAKNRVKAAADTARSKIRFKNDESKNKDASIGRLKRKYANVFSNGEGTAVYEDTKTKKEKTYKIKTKDNETADEAINRTDKAVKTGEKILKAQKAALKVSELVNKVTDKARKNMKKSENIRYDNEIGPEDTRSKKEDKTRNYNEEIGPENMSKDDRERKKKWPKLDEIMEKAGYKRQEKQSSPEEDMKKNINPDYDPNDPATSNNCAWCTAAFDLSQRGYDVEAGHITEDVLNTEDTICDWYEGEKLVDANKGAAEYINEHISTDENIKKYTQLVNNGVAPADANTYIASEVIAEKMKKEILDAANGADESWGHTLIFWRGSEGKQDAGGHDITYYTKGNEVHFLDNQTHEEYNLTDVIFASGMIWTDPKKGETITYNDMMKFMRTDNCDINESILDAVQTRKKKK